MAYVALFIVKNVVRIRKKQQFSNRGRSYLGGGFNPFEKY